MAEVIVKFSVTDLDNFYDWLQSAIEGECLISPDRAGYDAFYTLVKDGQAMTNFDPHLSIEKREATAIAEALKSVDYSASEGDLTHHGDSSNIDRISASLNALYSN
jgi:hypothetical protein